MFFNLEMTYSNTINLPGDVKEMIPEFFSGSGDFLTNTSCVLLGKDDKNRIVGDVVLPQWSDSIPDFISKN